MLFDPKTVVEQKVIEGTDLTLTLVRNEGATLYAWIVILHQGEVMMEYWDYHAKDERRARDRYANPFDAKPVAPDPEYCYHDAFARYTPPHG